MQKQCLNEVLRGAAFSFFCYARLGISNFDASPILPSQEPSTPCWGMLVDSCQAKLLELRSRTDEDRKAQAQGIFGHNFSHSSSPATDLTGCTDPAVWAEKGCLPLCEEGYSQQHDTSCSDFGMKVANKTPRDVEIRVQVAFQNAHRMRIRMRRAMWMPSRPSWRTWMTTCAGRRRVCSGKQRILL